MRLRSFFLGVAIRAAFAFVSAWAVAQWVLTMRQAFAGCGDLAILGTAALIVVASVAGEGVAVMWGRLRRPRAVSASDRITVPDPNEVGEREGAS